MAHASRFHSLHGPNVVLKNDRSEAVWCLESSGGLLFSEDPLGPGTHVTICCHGSGRIRVGCTTDNPTIYKSGVPHSLSDMREFELMNEIRFHKRECSVNMFVNKGGDKITSSCGFLKYDKVLHRKQPVWIVMYMMFGDVRITVQNCEGQKMKMSEFHGVNAKLNGDRTEASAIQQSPGAFCVLGSPIKPDENIFLCCQPTKDDTHPASNYYVKLLISDQGPDQITGSGFSFADLCDSKPELTVVETLRKQDCHGEIRVSLLKDYRFEYRSANNKVNSQSLLPKPTEGVWLYLELYRVHVKLFSYSRKEILNRQRCVSVRSDSTYQYTHISFGSRSRTLHDTRPSGGSGSRPDDSGEYVEMGHRSSSCPANLNRPVDEIDGIIDSLSELDTQVKTLYERMDSLTDIVTTDLANRAKSPSTQVNQTDVTNVDRDVTNVDRELSELRCAIRCNWTELINCIQTETMADLLFQYGVLSHIALDKIRRRLKMDGQEANRQILDVLLRKGISRDLLNKILDDAGESHLKKLFFKH